ncbi:EAL domain-containing protein [Providencia burhodogranariea]|uniref:Diguanylate cyclase/phosphodiesterase n=1 Tax=Providencia burhodogranariea DSM 19968 TaxID=1141662 RepID=K8WM41_9GAMM|nr:diguanylate cyclase/phosphodiesterase [Providencia burhodogranariea DSM 19968]
MSIASSVLICLFTIVQFYLFVEQRKTIYTKNLENISFLAVPILSEAIESNNDKKINSLLDDLVNITEIEKLEFIDNKNNKNNVKYSLYLHNYTEWYSKIIDIQILKRTPIYSSPVEGKKQVIGYITLYTNTMHAYQLFWIRFISLFLSYTILSAILIFCLSWQLKKRIIAPLKSLTYQLKGVPQNDDKFHQLTLSFEDEHDELSMLVRSYNDNQRALQKAKKSISQLSTHDPISLLPNMTLFQPVFEQYLLSSYGSSTGLIIIVVETLQETIGVLNAEQQQILIRKLVTRMKSGIEQTDLLGQIAPDRFIVLLRETDNPYQVMRIAQNLMSVVTDVVSVQEMTLRSIARIGISYQKNNVETVTESQIFAEDMIAQATSAINMAMREGKNQIVFFEPSLTDKAKERLVQEAQIVKALENGEFSLYLQPQVDIRTNKLSGAEALVRWTTDNGNINSPADFIPLAEEMGGIVPLGDWVLMQSLKVLSNWRILGIDIPISLNVSGVQLSHDGFIASIKEKLIEFEIPGNKLHIEITETACISNIIRTAEQLKELRELGVKIALDDFGIGYAGLNYLNNLPVDIIKIDKSLLDQIHDDNSLVRVIGLIGTALSIDIIAEGVDSKEKCDWLLANGIHYIQGYWISPALPVGDFNRKYQ